MSKIPVPGIVADTAKAVIDMMHADERFRADLERLLGDVHAHGCALKQVVISSAPLTAEEIALVRESLKSKK